MKPLRILLVAATEHEVIPLIEYLGDGSEKADHLLRFTTRNYNLDLLITGVGIPLTSALTAHYLALTKYQLAINAGVCGAYNRNLSIGEVVYVSSDNFPELGVDNNGIFESVFDLGFLNSNEFPFDQNRLLSCFKKNSEVLHPLKDVSANTVNTCSGQEFKIEELSKRTHADIESMEGAAFMMSCILAKVSCIQLRSVSNYVEKRNPDNWKVSLAINNLNTLLISFLNSL